MHRLHRFADDFFDSHFFALRFAVGSQCPKLDSQTAMRYRVNYSLSSTTLAKKIETGTQAKHRRVHARQVSGLCHVRAVVSIFLARVVVECT